MSSLYNELTLKNYNVYKPTKNTNTTIVKEIIVTETETKNNQIKNNSITLNYKYINVLILGLIFILLFVLYSIIKSDMFMMENYKQQIIELNNQIETIRLETKELKDELNEKELINTLYEGNEEKAFYSYMDYRAITDTSSKQYKIQENAYSDDEGLRKVGNAYCIALGSSYGKVGSYYEITLSNGHSFIAIKADAKSDRHTENGEVDKINGSRIEFVVDGSKMSNSSLLAGNLNKTISWLNGSIEKIKILKT